MIYLIRFAMMVSYNSLSVCKITVLVFGTSIVSVGFPSSALH